MAALIRHSLSLAAPSVRQISSASALLSSATKVIIIDVVDPITYAIQPKSSLVREQEPDEAMTELIRNFLEPASFHQVIQRFSIHTPSYLIFY